MDAGMIAVVVLAAAAALAAVLAILYYNSLIVRRNMVDQSYSTIDVMLQRRSDLVPNLVATVERYMRHESETLSRIAQYRSRITDRSVNLDERVAADGAMHKLIGNLMLQVENYPDLKSDQHFRQLFDSLESLEGQISASRRSYNAAVTTYNNAIETFPGLLFAGWFNFRKRVLLEASPEERVNPSVKDLFKG